MIINLDYLTGWFPGVVFALFGGLGIFLYGINKLGDSLKEFAGSKLKVIIEKTTNTPLKGILVGVLITGILQSSSATTALIVGLVSVGLMTLPQAVGVIMGANIGTTVTSFLIGLSINEFALPIVGIGAILIFFFRNKRLISFGGILLGFGLLFFGLDLMSAGLDQIAELEQVIEAFQSMSEYPILGLLTGSVVTGIIQSSSASIGILQGLYGTGSIEIPGAVAILLGANIGTTVTAVIASGGATAAAKRAALVHVLFNIFGAVLFLIILGPYSELIQIIETNILVPMFGTHPAMTISIAHIIFNLITTFIMFFFIKHIVKLVTRIIPGEIIDEITKGLIDDALIVESPVLALEFSKTAINKMGQTVKDFFHLTKDYSFNNESGKFDKGEEIEKSIDVINSRIHDYLIKITQTELGYTESHKLSKYIDTISDLERIGDHCMNIIEFFKERYENNLSLSNEGYNDLMEMYDLLTNMLEVSITALVENDKTIIKNIEDKEQHVDDLEEKLRRNHLLRLNSGACCFSAADNYVDILSNLERIGDHCYNIARTVIHDFYVVDSLDD